MSAVAERDDCSDEVRGEKYPSHLRVGKSNGRDGGMDDVLKRLGAVESTVSEIRSQVSTIVAVIPHLATKADLAAVRVEVAELGTKLIKWLIATGIATAGLVVTGMKFFH